MLKTLSINLAKFRKRRIEISGNGKYKYDGKIELDSKSEVSNSKVNGDKVKDNKFVKKKIIRKLEKHLSLKK